MKVFIDITEKNRNEYNRIASHPLQSFEWGEFREKTGIRVIRRTLVERDKIIDGFTLTLHKVPKLPYKIGYLPKGNLPTKEVIDELYKIGKESNCVFIQLEPNIAEGEISNLGLRPSFHPLFTKYTFLLDLTKSEEELLAAMHPKTRYNIKVAQKHGVEVAEDNSDEAFETYLKLTFETTKRQKFYAHNEEYHRKMWSTLKIQNSEWSHSSFLASSKIRIQNLNKLSAHLLVAKYSPHPTPTSKLTSHSSRPITLVSWILFVFHDTLYYPYGASANEHREVMASNLMMWEAIKFGKRIGLKRFDMWGALSPNPDTNDPWYGFHRFKQGYGTKLTEFAGSFDLVINPALYKLYKIGDKLRWLYLKMKN